MSKAEAKRKDMLVCLMGLGEVTPETEYRRRAEVSEEVSPLGPTPFGEHIGLYSGSLSFEQVDVDAAGNGLPLQVIRSFSPPSVAGTGPSTDSGSFPSNAFVDWSLEVPHIETLSAQRTTDNKWFFIQDASRCSSFVTAPNIVKNAYPGNPTNWLATIWWHGYQMVMPGAGRQEVLHKDSGNTQVPTSRVVDGHTVTFTLVTKDRWALGCLPTTSNGVAGEGFFAVSPDGTQYWLDRLVTYHAATMTVASPDSLPRQLVKMMVSKVQDRFGNTLTYGYDTHNNLTSITANDGRSVSLSWETWNGGAYYRVHSITWQPSGS